MYDISVKSFFIEDRTTTSQNEIFEIFVIKILGHFMDWLAKYVCKHVLSHARSSN